MRTSTSRISVLAVAATVVGITGCGGSNGSSDPREQALVAVHAYQDAAIHRDARAMCAMFTGAKKQEVVAGAAFLGGVSGCEASTEKVWDLEGADDLGKRRISRKATTAANITMSGRSAALATFTSGKTLPLVKVGDDWLVDAPAS